MKPVIINFLTKDMHLQKNDIDYEALYALVQARKVEVEDIILTPKNKEKIERKLKYLSSIDIQSMETYHEIDNYSLTLLKNKFGLQPKLKNKIVFECKIYRFIFDFYFYKHGINYDQFCAIDTNNVLLAEYLEINLDLILEKNENTLEIMSNKYNCTRESIRLRVKDTKNFVRKRFLLPDYPYVTENTFNTINTTDQIVLLSYHDEVWDDEFKAYILNKAINKKLDRFKLEINKLLNDYTYPISKVDASLSPLIDNFVTNHNYLYLEQDNIYSIARDGDHHNANYILNYLKAHKITVFYIEDLLHEKFLSTVHGKLMSSSITTTLRNLEAILDREEKLVKLDTHHYTLYDAISNISYIDWDQIEHQISIHEGSMDLETIEDIFEHKLQLLNIKSISFYYLLKKKFSDKFQFKKLVIYNKDYKLKTKFELLLEQFDKTKIIYLDDGLLTNATNLARKFKDKGGLIYGDKLYNVKLLDLTTTLEGITLKPDFEDIVFRSTFNNAIDDITLEEIDYKRKFAFKLWAFIHGLEYYNFYAGPETGITELHTLVYCINNKQKTIKYKYFIDIIEQISGSRKVYQILQNMIDSNLITSEETTSSDKLITFNTIDLDKKKMQATTTRKSSITVDNDLAKLTISELRKLAKEAHIKNINTYKKDQLISILQNTIKINIKK